MSATILEGDVDTRDFVVVDSEESNDEACDWDSPQCEHSADFVITMRCCGKRKVFCEDHMLRLMTVLTRASKIYHGTCKRYSTEKPFARVDRLS